VLGGTTTTETVTLKSTAVSARRRGLRAAQVIKDQVEVVKQVVIVWLQQGGEMVTRAAISTHFWRIREVVEYDRERP